MTCVTVSLAETGGPLGEAGAADVSAADAEAGAADDAGAAEADADALGEVVAVFVPQAKSGIAIAKHRRMTITVFNDFLISISPSLFFNGNHVWTGNIAVWLRLVASFQNIRGHLTFALLISSHLQQETK
jgi:hypothetical protein